MKQKIQHIANPLQSTEIEVAELRHDRTLVHGGAMVATTSGYVHATNIHGDAQLRWMNAGDNMHLAHCFPINGLSPADLEILTGTA